VYLHSDIARTWYAYDFQATPAATVLRALHGELQRAGVSALFVVAPINAMQITRAGLELDDIERHALQLRDAIGAQADEWMETTELFHAPDFQDPLHIRPEALERLAGYVADRLSERLASPLLDGHELLPSGDAIGH
jgi:hypothetical protein